MNIIFCAFFKVCISIEIFRQKTMPYKRFTSAPSTEMSVLRERPVVCWFSFSINAQLSKQQGFSSWSLKQSNRNNQVIKISHTWVWSILKNSGALCARVRWWWRQPVRFEDRPSIIAGWCMGPLFFSKQRPLSRTGSTILFERSIGFCAKNCTDSNLL